MYVCGPTVYNFIHIGNARPMIVFDTVRRYMEYKGYEVNYVSNFTDVDDKIIAKANEEGVSSRGDFRTLHRRVQKGYGRHECEAGNDASAGHTGDRRHDRYDSDADRQRLCYDNVNGTVYFRTRNFKDYGKLSHKNLDDLRVRQPFSSR